MSLNGSVLITGGAGFIGSHLADELLRNGYHVRVMDRLLPQVHGEHDATWPDYLDRQVELVKGDVRSPHDVRRALDGMDAVYHLAAAVGVGQSMYQIRRYADLNQLGTATLLEALIDRPVRRLIVASSMSIYGEGLYRDHAGHPFEAAERLRDQLMAHEWEVLSERGDRLDPVATPEWKRPVLTSTYALTKYSQERMCLITGRAHGIPTVALRFFNVYGSRQALSNPYTGVLAIFASRVLNGQPPLVFEDGRQQRDFVNVLDVARACRLALERDDAVGEAVNVGSGQAQTILTVASAMARVLGKPGIEPVVTGKYRVGDIRHCFADIGLARRLLDYEPGTEFEQGLSELAGWLEGRVSSDLVGQATDELVQRGLAI
jgi:dTDP-L-rhamnose 4-epimerase